MAVVAVKKVGGLKVEKGVPLPPLSGGRARYPWDAMEIGDSFFVPGRTSVEMAAIAASASHAKRRSGWRFSCRAESDGARVWRIA